MKWWQIHQKKKAKSIKLGNNRKKPEKSKKKVARRTVYRKIYETFDLACYCKEHIGKTPYMIEHSWNPRDGLISIVYDEDVSFV